MPMKGYIALDDDGDNQKVLWLGHSCNQIHNSSRVCAYLLKSCTAGVICFLVYLNCGGCF